MNLRKWMQPAEMVATIGVLVSVVFLVFEVRDNSALTKAESYSASVVALNEWRLQLAADEDLSRLFVEFRKSGVQGMDEVEVQRFDFLFGSLWSIYESAYFAREYETLGQNEWERHRGVMCRMYDLSVHHEFWSIMQAKLSPIFAEQVAIECRST